MNVKIECARCKMPFWVTDQFDEVARQTEQQFYCPAGHTNFYPLGEREADKLRRERDQLAQRIAQKDDEIKQQRERAEREERKTAAARGQITKLKKRAANGVCPCCNRTFMDLAWHMEKKHPTFVSEQDATEHTVN